VVGTKSYTGWDAFVNKMKNELKIVISVQFFLSDQWNSEKIVQAFKYSVKKISMRFQDLLAYKNRFH
jgi:hypothetical protein